MDAQSYPRTPSPRLHQTDGMSRLDVNTSSAIGEESGYFSPSTSETSPLQQSGPPLYQSTPIARHRAAATASEPSPVSRKRCREEDHIQGTQKSPCLSNEETSPDQYHEYERLGLGRAIDVTKTKPWKHRTTYQVRKVNSNNFAESDDSNEAEKFSEDTKSCSAFQTDAEASITNLKIPVRASVAVDFARSSKSRKFVTGRVIRKRTITLQNLELLDTPETPSKFMKVLEKELGDEHSDAIEDCSKLLKETYGGATHYISSITLGAMEFSVKQYTEADTSGGVGASAGVVSVGSVKTQVRAGANNSKTSTYDNKIGRMNEKDEVTQEGVVEYKYTPIASLFEEQHCKQGHVAEAVRRYIRQRRNSTKGITGPYSISFDKKKYWKVGSTANGKEKEIQVTTNAKEHSWFYIEKSSEEKIMISTTEDGRSTEYPRNPLYVQLRKVKGKYQLKLKVAPLANSSVVQFEVYDPNKSKEENNTNDGIDEPDWLPSSLDSVGRECYLIPQCQPGYFNVLQRYIIENFENGKRCLYFSSEDKIFLLPEEQSVRFTFSSATI